MSDLARPWVAEDGDTRCQKCGLPNPVWWADNGDWNRLMPNDGVFCPTCYHKLWLDSPTFSMPWDSDDDVGAWGDDRKSSSNGTTDA